MEIRDVRSGQKCFVSLIFLFDEDKLVGSTRKKQQRLLLLLSFLTLKAFICALNARTKSHSIIKGTT